MRRALALCLALAAVTAFDDAAAQEQQSDVACKDRRQAKREFNKGRLAYRRGDYEEAIVKWQESYAMCEEPLIHLNIANAYERIGDPRSALKHLELWRQVAPIREHGELDARLGSLRQRVAEQDKQDADKRAQEDARKKEEQDRLLQNPPPPAPPPAPPKRGFQTLDIVGWSLVGVGGAAVIAGVVMDVVAASARPEEAEACTIMNDRQLCREAARDDIESTNTLALAGDITWIAGAAVAASGATILVLSATGVLKKSADGRHAARRDGALLDELHLAPYGAGMQLFGRF